MTANIIFLSMYASKIDEKKRTSVPVAFRTIIEETKNEIVYAYPSFTNNCIEVCTIQRMRYLEDYIETLDMFSEERDALSAAIFAGCEPVQIDAKGRISISERLLRFAALDVEALFVGKGRVFEIWNRKIFEDYFSAARTRAKSSSAFKLGNALKLSDKT